VLTATAALRREGGTVVLRRKGGPEFRLRPRVVVGADGPGSTVGRWARAPRSRRLPAVQARLRLARSMDATEVRLHPDYRAGYGWLFPKGAEANAGVGFVPVPGGPTPTAVLSSFIGRLRAEGRVTGPVTAGHAGWIPVEPLRATVYGDVLLAGDAAGQAHPITGAGVFAAVTCGRMAGEWAARAAAADDVRLLQGYETEWRELLGETLERAAAKRRRMESGWERFDEIIRSCWVAFEEYYRPGAEQEDDR